jgi:repressor LexA
MPASLTELERKILDYMVQYLRTNTYQPSIREIGEQFGIKSTKTVSEHLQALADKGFLERDPSRSRGVKILGMDLNAQTVSIPCYRELPQDRSGLLGERAEMFLSMDRRLAGAKGSFFVRAHGVELVGHGISDGDFVLIEPTTPDSITEGALVVARLGGRSNYYRFRRNGVGVTLQPLGAAEEPTLIDEPHKLNLVGKVTAFYRRLDGVAMPVSVTAH